MNYTTIQQNIEHLLNYKMGDILIYSPCGVIEKYKPQEVYKQ